MAETDAMPVFAIVNRKKRVTSASRRRRSRSLVSGNLGGNELSYMSPKYCPRFTIPITMSMNRDA